MRDGLIDFHSHVLPRLDDGADSIETSVAMLSMLREQGVDIVYATPHYLASEQTTEQFCRRRQNSYERLVSAYKKEASPDIRLGAEIRVMQGISERDLSPLVLGGTRALLLEMPTCELTHSLINEIRIIHSIGCIPIIAHIDRYTWYRSTDIEHLSEISDVVFQVNAGALRSFGTRRLVSRLMRMGCRIVFGSDAHNTSDRSPEFYRLTAKKKRSPLSKSRRNALLCVHESGTAFLHDEEHGYGLVF